MFAIHPECPSELALDRALLGELSPEAARAVRAHVEPCARCRDRIALRERGIGAFPGVDPSRMFRAIRERLGVEDPPAARPPERPARVYLTAAAAAMLVATLVITSIPAPEEVRAKGGPSLAVYRERAGRVVRAASGDVFRKKDRLRFEIGGTGGEIMIVSVERGGKVSTFYPPGGSERSEKPELAADGALSGAIELDGSPNDEVVHLVECPRRFWLADLRPHPAPGVLDVPSGCETTSFTLRKEAAP